jgi:aryl-alcohol dehydrogenase-like predicted oxidoreductase
MFGVGSIPWSTLARGFLARPLGEETTRGNNDWLAFALKYNKNNRITSFKGQSQATESMNQIMLL